jgi:membrane-associated phospholipid phosphatase
VRSFQPDDPAIAYPNRPDSVPEWSLAFTALVPLVAVGLAQIPNPSWHDVHHAALGLSETFALTLLATVALKRSVGRLRPDFLDRCDPLPDGTCTGDPEEIRRGRESFPSGHTSMAFAGGTFLSLYLWGKLRPFATGGALWKMLVVLSPVAAASLVGLSRIWDHRHRWEDVAAGAVLGAGFALLGYRLNFPWPWASAGGRPSRRTRWAVVPTAGTGQIGLLAHGRFSFHDPE